MSEAREDTRVGLIGKTIGRYRVTAELGRGGMATVYRAHDPQLGRDVAIKVMHGAFAGRDDLEARFRREARAVAAVKHDGIVNVFDFAPAGAGEPGYIVTEIVEGPTLRSLMEKNGGRLLPEVAALIAARVAGALGAAHARGIVHRDVKPDNVMFDLATGGGAVRVMLTDFGIAHMTEADTMTATGAIVGSPSYMSPEQARGLAITPASDVFSLGVMLYQITTGRTPFAGKDPMTAIAAIQRGEFLRPSQVDAHVGPALEAVIVRCLQKLPATRFGDGNAVEAALAGIARDVQKTLDLGDAAAVLRRFFDDAGAFAAVVRPRVAAQAFEQAKAHVRRRELTRALSEINRVFAYAPAHAGAQALLNGIARRRKTGRLVAAGLVLVALATAGVGAQRWRAGRRMIASRATAAMGVEAAGAAVAGARGGRGGAGVAVGAATAAGAAMEGGTSSRRPGLASGERRGGADESPGIAADATARSRAAAGAMGPGAGAAATALAAGSPPLSGHGRPPPTATDKAPRSRTTSPTSVGAKSANAPSAGTPARATRVAGATAGGVMTPPAAGAATSVPSGAAASSAAAAGGTSPALAAGTSAALAASALQPERGAAVSPTPPPSPLRAAATASLSLRASQGFCSPSMDDGPAAIHPSYDHVAAGSHRLYCTLPGGAKSFIATYDLRPGARPNLVIVPGVDGKPTLARPE